MSDSEEIIFQNEFGKVTNRRIVLKYPNGQEDLALHQVSSITLQHERNGVVALFGFVVAFIMMTFIFSGQAPTGLRLIMAIIAIVGILTGLANWYGHHNIVLSTSGQNRKPLKVEMAKTKEGQAFVRAVKKEIFK